MKRILILLAAAAFFGCHDVTVGYLTTENAEYAPKEMEIPKEIPATYPNYAIRTANNSPWVTSVIQGVMGTQPINYEIAGVKASEGGNAEAFKAELEIRGAGLMQVPLYPQAPVGKYVVSIRVYNEGYSHVLEEVYTFNIVE